MKSTLSLSSDRCWASAADLSGPADGTWKNGMPNARTSPAVSGWFETTMATVIGSSPRRCRQSRSSRQWSAFDAKIATRCGMDRSRSRNSSSNPLPSCLVRSSSMSGSAALRLSRLNTVRWKNAPPCGLSLYWSSDTMFAWCLLSTEPTAATMPVRSRPCTISEAWLRVCVGDGASSGASWAMVTSALLPVVRDPVRRGPQAAEGVEVQLDLAVPARVVVGGEGAQEAAGSGRPHQVGERQAVLAGDRRARADAEAAGEAQQPPHAGRAGNPDPHRRVDAHLPGGLDPVENRVGVEPELGDDLAAQAAALDRGVLVRQRRPEQLIRNIGMSFRISGKAHLSDTVLLQQAGLDHRQRVGVRSMRPARVA